MRIIVLVILKQENPSKTHWAQKKRMEEKAAGCGRTSYMCCIYSQNKTTTYDSYTGKRLNDIGQRRETVAWINIYKNVGKQVVNEILQINLELGYRERYKYLTLEKNMF